MTDSTDPRIEAVAHALLHKDTRDLKNCTRLAKAALAAADAVVWRDMGCYVFGQQVDIWWDDGSGYGCRYPDCMMDEDGIWHDDDGNRITQDYVKAWCYAASPPQSEDSETSSLTKVSED